MKTPPQESEDPKIAARVGGAKHDKANTMYRALQLYDDDKPTGMYTVGRKLNGVWVFATPTNLDADFARETAKRFNKGAFGSET